MRKVSTGVYRQNGTWLGAPKHGRVSAELGVRGHLSVGNGSVWLTDEPFNSADGRAPTQNQLVAPEDARRRALSSNEESH